MSNTTTPKFTHQRGFEILVEQINKQKDPPAIQKRIMAHLRAVTGRPVALPVYHNDKNISDDDKCGLYKLLVKCILANNYAPLQGQVGQGDRRMEPETPAVATVDVEPPVASRHVESPGNITEVETPQPPGDDLTRLIISKLTPYLPQGRAVDEKTVRRIVDEQLKDAVPYQEDSLKRLMLDTITHAMGNGHFPTERVKKIVDDALGGLVLHIAITAPDGKMTEINRQHYKFPLLMAALSQRLNVLLVGPAGSSKTTAAHAASKAVELAFEAISVGPMTSKADLFGFVDAHGKYHDTATVRRAVDGGVLLWDEVDAANAGVLTSGNMLMANEHVATPVGMKEKHKDFMLIAAANTYGMGANRVYVGRNQLDGATLDRFVVIDWDYDEGLEASIVGVLKKSPTLNVKEGGSLSAKDWLDYVHKVRAACEKLAIRHVVSPRASIHGVKLFAAGVGRKHVEEMVLWKGMDAATRNKITGNLQ